MSNATKNQPEVEATPEAAKVNDKRRFDGEGNARSAAEEGAPVVDESQKLISQLQSDLEATRRRFDELARAYQAQERDREEFKQRVNRERERMLDVERGNVAQFVLDAVDELELCLTAADDSPLAQGVRMIRDGMLRKLESVGIQKVSLLGQVFDPNLAEAADMEVTTEPQSDQKVISELRPAYRLKDRIIRAGRVKVAKYVEPALA